MDDLDDKPLSSRLDLRVPAGFQARTKLAAAVMGVTPSELMRRAIVRQLTEVLCTPAVTSPNRGNSK